MVYEGSIDILIGQLVQISIGETAPPWFHFELVRKLAPFGNQSRPELSAVWSS